MGRKSNSGFALQLNFCSVENFAISWIVLAPNVESSIDHFLFVSRHLHHIQA